MIKAIFFCKFDIHEGPKVIHQVPNESITPSPTATTTNKPLIHFPSIAPTIIPRQTFCSLPITILHSHYRILSHPICLSSPSYPRNEFIFNFALVLSRHTDPTAYASVTAKIAQLFADLEQTSSFLSNDLSPPNTGKIYALCEILLEDLNNYCECMIPIDDSNTLNIKLFPTYPPPPPVAPHQVPLAIVRLEALTDPNWDLTVLRILPYINGVNSVKRIAHLAEADYSLVRKAVAHLLYYGCVMLLDIFSFGASYAPTAEIGAFVRDHEAQDECRRYVVTGDTQPSSRLGLDERRGLDAKKILAASIDSTCLVELYTSLRQGQSIRTWCIEHADIISVVDIRRFITFGVIKGFLYRIHKYAVVTSAPSLPLVDPSEARIHRNSEGVEGKPQSGDKENIPTDHAALARFLDGTHCFDEICTQLMISDRELLLRLKDHGDVQIIQR